MKSKILQSSVSRFSTGVPLMATLDFALNAFTDLVFGYLEYYCQDSSPTRRDD